MDLILKKINEDLYTFAFYSLQRIEVFFFTNTIFMNLSIKITTLIINI